MAVPQQKILLAIILINDKMTPKEHAIQLRNEFRIYTGQSIDNDGIPVNNYLSSKHTAKKAAIICIEKMMQITMDVPTYNELVKVKIELQNL